MDVSGTRLSDNGVNFYEISYEEFWELVRSCGDLDSDRTALDRLLSYFPFMYVAIPESPWCGCHVVNGSGKRIHRRCETLKEIEERKRRGDERTGFPSHGCICELRRRKEELGEALKKRVKEWLSLLADRNSVWCSGCDRPLLLNLEGHPCFPVVPPEGFDFRRRLFPDDPEDILAEPLSPIPRTPSPTVSDFENILAEPSYPIPTKPSPTVSYEFSLFDI